MASVIDLGKAQAAKLQGLHYYWHVELRNGECRDQFSESGEENSLRGIQMLRRSPLEPYSGSMVFLGVKMGAWVPSFEGGKIFKVTLEEDADGLVLYRKTYTGSAGFSYRAYVIGRHWDRDGSPVEHTWSICPACRLPPRYEGDAVVYPGGITDTIEPIAKNHFDQWTETENYGKF